MDLVKTVSTLERRWKEDEKRRERWKRFRELYTSNFWDENTTDETLSRVDSGKLFSTVSQLAPLMTDNRPVWSLTARDPVFQPIIQQWDKALNYLWGILDMSNVVNDAYQDALLMEQGCVQVEYDDEKQEVEVSVVDPRHLVFAPGDYDDINQCPWVCKRKAYTLSDVRRTYPDKSDKLVADTIDKDSTYDDVLHSSNSWVTIYELWIRDDTVEEDVETDNNPQRDKKVKKKLKYPNGRFLIFTKTGEESKPVLLDDYPSPYEHGNPPFVMVYDYRVSHSIWGIGEGLHLMPLIDELNSVLQSISWKLRNTCRPNFAADPKIVDVNEIQSDFHKGGQLFTKKGQDDADPRYTGVEMMPVAPPLQTELQFITYLQELIEELTSVTAIVKGQSGKRERQTAQEWSGMYEASHTRTRLRVRNMERSLRKILELILIVAMQNYNQDRAFKTNDPDGGMSYGYISNTKERAAKAVVDNVDEQFDMMEQEDSDEAPSMFGETNREDAKRTALQRLLLALPVTENKIMARFHMEIQSQSTLPTDIQSRANLALRLAQQGIIDAQATLEELQWPNAAEIVRRMEEKAMAAAQAAGQIQEQPAGPDAGGFGEETQIQGPALVEE